MTSSTLPSRSLLTCPYCGKGAPTVHVESSMDELEEYERDHGHPESWTVVCDAATEKKLGGCGASSGYMFSPEEAVERWNARTSPSEKRIIDDEAIDSLLLGMDLHAVSPGGAINLEVARQMVREWYGEEAPPSKPASTEQTEREHLQMQIGYLAAQVSMHTGGEIPAIVKDAADQTSLSSWERK